VDYSIAFPNLGIELPCVIKSFTVFGYEIAMYGITMALGILLGLQLASFIARKTGQREDDYMNITLLGIVLGLLGGRLYYVIFSWDYYSAHPAEILNLRGGGLAIYGAVIGAVLSAVMYSKVKKLNIPLVLDTAVCGLVLGQIVGRWGNFFNREAFGEYTDSLLAMRLPVNAVRESEITELMREHLQVIGGTEYIQVHPTFLYESLWNAGVLILLLVITFRHMKKFDGEIFLIYLSLYGVGRFWVESLRTDQLLIWGTDIPVSQVVAAVCAVAAAACVCVLRRKAVSKRSARHGGWKPAE